MCQEIIDKVAEFVTGDTMFTSVDVSNAIKRDGVWVSNKEVAGYLRRNLTTLFPNYSSTRIPVLNGAETATLYHPVGVDTDCYQNRDQHAMTPAEAGISIQNTNPTPTPVVAPIVLSPAPVAITQSDDDKVVVAPDSEGFLRLPATIITKMGWAAGDTVDKAKILVNAKDVPDNLVVHKDGRVKIPRDCIAWGKDPVNVFINNGFICFDKVG